MVLLNPGKTIAISDIENLVGAAHGPVVKTKPVGLTLAESEQHCLQNALIQCRGKVNGQFISIDIDPEKPLLWVLREDLALTGTKYGCGIGNCGACTVIIDREELESRVFRPV